MCDSYDNALVQILNGLQKADLIHRRGTWRSLEQLELAALDRVDWYNNRRLLGAIGNIPPTEAEARHHAQLNDPAMVA